MSSPKIFITGATGYLGGSFLSKLLTVVNPATITALARSEDKAAKLRTLEVQTVIGSYKDVDVLTDAASKADIVLTFVDADDHVAAQAILDGMKKKHETDGSVPALIHTSGTGVIQDNALGLHNKYPVFSDLDLDRLASIPEEAIHRKTDLLILAADKQGYIRSYLVLPPTVYGLATGVVADLGIQNIHSVQFPAIVKTSMFRKQGGMIGEGVNVWHNVSLSDTVDFYVLLFNTVVKRPDTAHGAEGYYFLENGEHSLREVATEISKALVELGIGTNPEPSSYTEEEKEAFFGPLWPFLGTNARVRADRSRALGWKPVDGKDKMVASLKAEIVSFLPPA
ncbi:NAD(P)-binding protein [Desarmillaria tabescens]|uniref:NAD(P)-binding protein n=1 Tax=Armillaria tabescens TaxID=1929756 RepID=A0AA39MX28_ARMTA|nr:NAD(P)-binding protein [Desarmillaria tabescens]KAK0449822.1 NAD(P)-binding protein [Desarmillaria tabescens]